MCNTICGCDHPLWHANIRKLSELFYGQLLVPSYTLNSNKNHRKCAYQTYFNDLFCEIGYVLCAAVDTRKIKSNEFEYGIRLIFSYECIAGDRMYVKCLCHWTNIERRMWLSIPKLIMVKRVLDVTWFETCCCMKIPIRLKAKRFACPNICQVAERLFDIRISKLHRLFLNTKHLNKYSWQNHWEVRYTFLCIGHHQLAR